MVLTKRRPMASRRKTGQFKSMFRPQVEALENRYVPVQGTRFFEAVSSNLGVVASINDQASAVGIDVLNHGGNAVDAAVATVFAVGVAEPWSGGIGGIGYLVYRDQDGSTDALDFGGSWPHAVTPTTYDIEGLHKDRDGHLTVAIPNVVAGMADTLRKHGTISLQEAIMGFSDSTVPYAYQLARNGIIVTEMLASFEASNALKLRYYPETADIYLIEGAVPYPIGSTLRQTDYARSLRLIAEQGTSAFYEGEIAHAIMADMANAKQAAEENPLLLAAGARNKTTNIANGTTDPNNPGHRWEQPNDIGLMTADDLASHQLFWRTPLRGTYRQHQIVGMPPSTAGGIATLEIMNILEGYPLNTVVTDENGKVRDYREAQADYLHVLAEAQKLAWADLFAYVGDPAFEDVPTDTLISKGYGKKRRDAIDLDHAKSFPSDVPPGKAHTNHISIIDKNGNAVAVTHTLGDPFGSFVVAPGTGFLLNDFLGTGPVPATLDFPEGGKRGLSTQTPTIVVHHGKPILVTGASGGYAIPLGVVQQIVNVVDFRMDIAHAVDAQRIDAVAKNGGDGLGLAVESPSTQIPGDEDLSPVMRTRISDGVLDELARRGHHIIRKGEYDINPWVNSAGIDSLTGRKQAVTDPRELANRFLTPFLHNHAAAQEDASGDERAMPVSSSNSMDLVEFLADEPEQPAATTTSPTSTSVETTASADSGTASVDAYFAAAEEDPNMIISPATQVDAFAILEGDLLAAVLPQIWA